MRRNTLATMSFLTMFALLQGSLVKAQSEYSDPQTRLAGMEREEIPGYAQASSDPNAPPQPLRSSRPAVYTMTDPTTITNCSTAGDACNSCCTSSSDSCCQSGCNSCQSGCNSCSSGCCGNGCCKGGLGGYGGAPVGGFVGGAEFVFLRPFASNGDLPNANFGLAGGIGQTDRTLDFNYKITPRVFFGYVGASGLGARVRYWQFDHGGSPNTATDPTSGNVATIAGGLKFQTFDLELTQQSQFMNWNLLFSGGLRYASFALNSGNSIVDGGGVALGFNNMNQSVSGTGLTSALQARRALNASGSLQFLTNLRGSILFGNHRSSVEMFANLPGVGAFGNASTTKNRDDLFSIWEINIGPQWSMPLANGARLVVGGTVEAQLWQGVGTSTYSATNSNGLGLGNMGLVGFGGNFGIIR